MEMKKILIITDAWFPQVNGVITTYINLIRGLKESNYDVQVISPEDFKYKIYPKQYKEVPLTIPFGLFKKIKESKADYYHIATEGPLGFFSSMYLKAKKIDFTTSYHTNWSPFLKDIAGIPEFLVTRYLFSFHKNRRVFCPTITTKKYLEEHKIGKEHIVWTRGIDIDIFSKTRKEESKDEKKKLLYVGRVSKEKNLDAFLRFSEDPRYHCIVVGNGPYQKELKRRYKKAEFRGYQFGEELVESYCEADVFVFPSKVDTFGLVMIESMCCGTPVAAYPVQGPIDVVKHGKTGFMHVNLEYAISGALLLDREKVSKCARKNWSWKETTKIFLKNIVSQLT